MWPFKWILLSTYLYIICRFQTEGNISASHLFYIRKDIGLSLATLNARHFCLASNYEKSLTLFPKYDATTGLLIVTLLMDKLL